MKSALKSMSNVELRKTARKFEAPNPFLDELHRRDRKRRRRRSARR
ncbi:MAG: hypothetical protein IKJ89_06780 [Kiritimatiellae bacterium]|nr:hypothetical protein [Kiritimatiellia bacterium]